MKEFIDSWRKFTKKLITENQDQVQAAQQNMAATVNYTKQLNKKAAAEVETAKQKAKAESDAELAAKKAKQAGAKTGISGTSPTTASTIGTLGEEIDETVGLEGEQEGSMGSAPVSSEEQLLPLKETELTEDMCGEYEGLDEDGNACTVEMMYEDRECACAEELEEANYKGRKVSLNKPMRGDVKKFKVFVKDPSTGNVKKVNFGDKTMRIKKSNPARRKSFRARHRCNNPGPKTKARYWSCRKW